MGISNDGTILEIVIGSLDISPRDFEIARIRYLAVAKWLEEGEYESRDITEIYLQGSFKLGTVIRPYRMSKDADFDIDQVCEIIGSDSTARQLKQDIGERLNLNADYRRILDEEGKRCWTLIYASEENVPGFHLDILPSRPKNRISNYIDITHKNGSNYSWRSSNPKGYYYWFKGKNGLNNILFETQRKSIFSQNKNLYKSVEDVPKQLIRTPLQRSIQLLKRHRDVFFNQKEHKPISIILTTICAHKYLDQGILETIKTFTSYITNRHSIVTQGVELPLDNILNYQDRNWIIKNPADGNENFADKWKDKPELAESFFSWVYQLHRDISAFNISFNTHDLNLVAPGESGGSLTYGQYLLNIMKHGSIGNSDPFLSLIHQGIEGKISWDKINEVAKRNVDNESESGDGKDIAWINFYQVKIHSGTLLDDQEKSHIRSILSYHKSNTSFILCCNLLLGSATGHMLQDCIKERDESVIKWPIIRLAKGQIQENSRMIIPVIG